MKKYLFIIIICFTVTCYVNAQIPPLGNSKNDLLTKPFIERPLTLYKKQLSFYAGYDYNLIFNEFNENGEIRSLAKNGYNTLDNSWTYSIKYGITDCLEAGLRGDYNNSKAFQNSVYYQFQDLDTSYHTIQQIKTIQTKGFTSPDLYIKYNLPLPSKKFSFAISAGTSLSFPESIEKEPEIKRVDNVYTDLLNRKYKSETYNVTINRQVNHPFKFLASIESKINLHKSCLLLLGSFHKGISTENVTGWDTELNTDNQTYYKNSSRISYHYGDLFSYSTQYAYQAKPFFMISLGISGSNYSGGSIKDFLIEYPDLTWYNLNAQLGYELQLTPNILLNQSIIKTLKGKNTNNTFLISSSLIINLIL